ncbi:MAG TPA: cell division protein FtsX, partial [Stenotrophomonas sp.]|nr:cell division protein FtsX [Stenotrophomonas sp.]
MFKNYLLIAWRNITHNKLYTGIILAGLVVGLTCAMLVATFVRHELSYDRSIPHYERTYRVGFQVLENGVHVTTAKLAPAAAPYVKDNVAGIEAVVRMYSLQGNQFRVIRDEAVFNQDDVYFADPNV